MKKTANRSRQARKEYDFSGGVRGKHFRDYRSGHRVQVTKTDGTVEEHHFTLADGAVMVDPDLKKRFPNSHAVNKALRSLIVRVKRSKKTAARSTR